MKRAAVYLLPIGLWAGTILILSSQSKLPTVAVNHFERGTLFAKPGNPTVLAKPGEDLAFKVSRFHAS